MRTLNKEELKAIADDIFDRYPKAQKVAVTSDGMAFIVDDSDLAVKNHAARNVYKKELEITTFRREEKDSDVLYFASADKALAAVDSASDAASLEAIRAVVESGKKWKTVLAAIEEKLQTLNS
jgi:hypothetical protein